MAGAEPTSAPSSPGGHGHGSGLVIAPDPESLALVVATAVMNEARVAVEKTGRFNVALSGGSSPRRAYEILGLPPFSEDVPWDSTHVYWGDERCVSPDDPRSNEKMAREALLAHVPLPAAQVHPMRCGSGPGAGPGTTDAAAVERAAREYEAMLRAQALTLDLVLLGLGTDGHTASLFPGSDALLETERWVVPAEHDSLWRLTLTAAFINRAAAVFFVVSGPEKAGVVKQVLEGGPIYPAADRSRLPAQSIAPIDGRLVWFVDEEAAAEIDRGKLPR